MSYLLCHWSTKTHVWTVAIEAEIASKVSDQVERLLARIRAEEGEE